MSVLEARCKDLEAHANDVADSLVGKIMTQWEKFKDDYDISNVPSELFSRTDLDTAYVKSVLSSGKGSGARVTKLKLQAEMLQAMQRSTTMRYSRSRIWAMAAAYSRRWSIHDGKQVGRLPEFVTE